MSNSTAIATIDNASTADFLALTGMGEKRESTPRLSVNAAYENDEGKPIPAGAFTFEHPQLGVVYSKSITLRVLLRCYQYRRWDQSANGGKGAVTNYSKMIKSFREEAFDILGTLRCGKVPNKEFDGLSKEQQERQKGVKCYQILMGVVSGTFANADGKSIEVENIPVIWRTRGKNYMVMSDMLNDLVKKNVIPPQININLTTKKEKNGATTYFVAVPVADTAKTVWRGKEDEDILRNFLAYVDASNKNTYEKYVAATKGKFTAVDATDKDDVEDIIDGEFTTVADGLPASDDLSPSSPVALGA